VCVESRTLTLRLLTKPTRRCVSSGLQKDPRHILRMPFFMPPMLAASTHVFVAQRY
jgi:hypothetical protein